MLSSVLMGLAIVAISLEMTITATVLGAAALYCSTSG